MPWKCVSKKRLLPIHPTPKSQHILSWLLEPTVRVSGIWYIWNSALPAIGCKKNTSVPQFWRMPTSGSQYIVEMCSFSLALVSHLFQVVFKSEFNFTRTQSMLTSQSRLHVVCSNHTTKPVIICFDISSPHIGCNLRVYARWTRSTAGVISSVAESLPRSKKKFALKIELNGCFPLPQLIESKSSINI